MMSAEKSKTTNIGVILLAAGESSRLGRPKQLLSYDDQTLLHHSLQEAIESKAQPIVVVLGAHADIIKREIDGVNVHVVQNEDWQEGMASSIRCGMVTFKQISPNAEGVIIMVCDQPYISAFLLSELITAHQKTGKPIVASNFENTFGPPVFFHNTFFDELLELKGDVGAKTIIHQHIDAVEVVPFPEGTYDVDTEADYERIKSIGNQ